MDVSIILISHNKYPQNLFSLFALQNQIYDQSKMEVILVDDNSTDDTITLKQYQPTFHFKYIRSNHTLDRAGAKNLGLREAEGSIIIFLDGEIMVDQYFVAKHVRHHLQEPVAVSGTSSHFCTFSILHPDFTKNQVKHLFYMIWEKPLFLNRLANNLGIPTRHAKNFEEFYRYAGNNRICIPIITKEDIDTEQFKQLSFPLPSFLEILERFGDHLAGYYLAWTFLITRNVSVSKSSIDAVGLFNEKFRGWGYEDWELGYRLYKKGVKIIEDRDIITYHQEHPFSSLNRSKEQMHNYMLLTSLHPDIEVCASTLDLLGKKNFLEVNNIIRDYHLLDKEFPDEFICAKISFLKLTQQIPFILFQEKPVTQLLQQVELSTGTIKNLFVELEYLRQSGKYEHLISAFDLLLNL